MIGGGEGEMNRNRIVICKKCGKSMRSDKLKRHDQTHMQKLEIDREEKNDRIIEKNTIEDLREELLEDNNIYLNKIELGRNISLIIQEGVVQEES